MSSQEKPEYVLFISQNCKFCNNFLTKLKTKQALFKKFNVVNIDQLNEVPNEVNEVPCVYDGKGIFQGKPAFTWLNEKMSDYLDAANDGLLYSFLEGQEEEQIFSNYSLLEQKNGSYGMGENGSDPTRLAKLSNNDNKNRTLDSIMASRNSEVPLK